MTLIQPNKQNFFLNLIMFVLIATVSVAVLWLILLYNQTVSLAHGAQTMTEAAKQIETENSELKGQIFAVFSPEAVAAFAAERGMITDRTPEYSPILSEWVVASGR